MTALSTLVEPLKRELAVPGTFDDVFENTTDADLLASLADGFAEARLRGFFPTMDLAAVTGGEPDPDYETSEDLSLAGTALTLIFTSMRILRAQIRAMNTLERYKAGPTEFEIQHASSLLKAELDYMQKRIDDIVAEAQTAVRPLAAFQYDNYSARVEASFYGGLYAHEYGA